MPPLLAASPPGMREWGMDTNDDVLVRLTPEQCLERLATHVVGRVVTRVGEIVDIFPINYALDGGDIILRTAEGTKLTEMLIGGEVLFEVDEFDDEQAWSVVVRGSAQLLEKEADIAAADALPLKPMAPTMKRNYVRIVAHSMTGRAFARSEEPSREGPQDY